jgi:hypothetical protein
MSRDYNAMLNFRDEHDDEPDGAFFQMAMDIHGWGAEDWAWWAEEYDRREHAAQGQEKK